MVDAVKALAVIKLINHVRPSVHSTVMPCVFDENQTTPEAALIKAIAKHHRRFITPANLVLRSTYAVRPDAKVRNRIVFDRVYVYDLDTDLDFVKRTGAVLPSDDWEAHQSWYATKI